MKEVTASKLVKALSVDYETAAKLVEAGFTTENEAKGATLKELTAIPGIGQTTAKQIKGA